jgi:Cohesin domain
MKKILIYFGIALLSLCMFFPVKGMADAILSVSGPSNISVGDSFTIDVVVSQAVDLYAFQFDLGFNPAILQATGFAEGTFLTSQGPTFFFNNGIDNTAGTVASNVDTLLGAPIGGDGTGTLVDFNFTAIAAGTSDITVSNALLSDSSANPLPFSIEDGTVNVAGVIVPTPEPSVVSMLLAASLLIGLLWFPRR